jgi:hypothetical protein
MVPEWIWHIAEIGGLVLSVWKFHDSIKKDQDKRHIENQTRLTALENTMKPIVEWFQVNVINRSRW